MKRSLQTTPVLLTTLLRRADHPSLSRVWECASHLPTVLLHHTCGSTRASSLPSSIVVWLGAHEPPPHCHSASCAHLTPFISQNPKMQRIIPTKIPEISDLTFAYIFSTNPEIPKPISMHFPKGKKKYLSLSLFKPHLGFGRRWHQRTSRRKGAPPRVSPSPSCRCDGSLLQLAPSVSPC